jgi:hypothetical protein
MFWPATFTRACRAAEAASHGLTIALRRYDRGRDGPSAHASGRPPHRSEQAVLPQSAPTLGSIVEAVPGIGMEHARRSRHARGRRPSPAFEIRRAKPRMHPDVGTCEMIQGLQGPERVIRPPETALCPQVLAHLRAKPDPPKAPSGSMVGREGVAAAALILRWG